MVVVGPAIVLPYNVTFGLQSGFVVQSNIVQSGNAWYVLAAFQPQYHSGNGSNYERICLFRSSNVLSADAWRGWNGSAFSVTTLTISNPGSNFCTGVLPFTFRFDLRFSSICNCWITLGASQTAWLYSTSYDLIYWTPGGFSGPSPALPTVTALKVLILRCVGPIRLHLERIGCAFRRCALGCGPSPSSPATGNARGGPNKRRCRRSHAARLHSHRWPGRDGTSICETRCSSGGASGVARAAPAVCGVLEPAASQSVLSSALAARGGSQNVVALR